GAIADGFQQRIVSQAIGVVAVLVAQSDLEDALPGLLLARVKRPQRVSVVVEMGSKTRRDAESVIDLAQEQGSSVGGDFWGIELDNDRRVWVEREAYLWGTLCHGGCSPMGSCSVLAELHLSHRHPPCHSHS